MYIEFSIPSGGGGMPAQYTNHWLKHNLKSWAERYSITYRTKDIRYTVRLTFDDDKLYDFFALTWNPRNPELKNYRMIEPMKLDNS
jgi:hypothetical protein